MTKAIHLGFEIGTGKPVAVPIAHMAVTGQTQASGKTTTLEALVSRAGATALTFVTKRGEASFAGGRRVLPYFRDRADWQFVTSILDATLQEKNKFLRPWIMKICRTTKTLAEVQNRVRDALGTAKGINEGVYTQLDAYLDLLVPEIERADLAERLDLSPGINVMDVSSFATPMQMLFVQSAMDWVNEQSRKTIIVVPEAWEFIPEGKGSPVKASAVTLVRKGAGIGNFIWVDSQDMAGVDKTILRGSTVWLIGVQREANEIKRNLANIPAGIQRPKPDEIALLEKGQFFACFGRTIAKVYVQPSWLDDETARAVALGTATIHGVIARQPKEEEVNEREAQELRQRNEELAAAVKRLEAECQAARGAPATPVDQSKIDAAETRGFEKGFEAGIARQMENIAGLRADVDRVFAEFLNFFHVKEVMVKATPSVRQALDGISRQAIVSLHEGTRGPGIPARALPPAPAMKAQALKRPRPSADPNAEPPAAAKLLAAMARAHLSADTWNEVCLVAGMLCGNGYFYAGKRYLIDAGLVEEADGGKPIITAEGLKVAGGRGAITSRAEILSIWRAR